MPPHERRRWERTIRGSEQDEPAARDERSDVADEISGRNHHMRLTGVKRSAQAVRDVAVWQLFDAVVGKRGPKTVAEQASESLRSDGSADGSRANLRW